MILITTIELSEFANLLEKNFENDVVELEVDVAKIRDLPKFTMEELLVVLKKDEKWQSRRHRIMLVLNFWRHYLGCTIIF